MRHPEKNNCSSAADTKEKKRIIDFKKNEEETLKEFSLMKEKINDMISKYIDDNFGKYSDCFKSVSLKDEKKPPTNGKVKFALELVSTLKDFDDIQSFVNYVGNYVLFLTAVGELLLTGGKGEHCGTKSVTSAKEFNELSLLFPNFYDALLRNNRDSPNILNLTKKFEEMGVLPENFKFCIDDLLSVISTMVEGVATKKIKELLVEWRQSMVLYRQAVESKLAQLQLFWKMFLTSFLKNSKVAYCGDDEEKDNIISVVEKLNDTMCSSVSPVLNLQCGQCLEFKWALTISFISNSNISLPSSMYKEDGDAWEPRYVDYEKARKRTLAVSTLKTLAVKASSPVSVDKLPAVLDESEFGTFKQSALQQEGADLDTTFNLSTGSFNNEQSGKKEKVIDLSFETVPIEEEEVTVVLQYSNKDYENELYNYSFQAFRKTVNLSNEIFNAAKRYIAKAKEDHLNDYQIKTEMIIMFCNLCKFLFKITLLFLVITFYSLQIKQLEIRHISLRKKDLKKKISIIIQKSKMRDPKRNNV